MRRYFAPVVALLLMSHAASPLLAADLFLKSKTVRVEGVADLRSMSEAQARETAIKAAQRSAIEQVVGTLIESSFSSAQKEVVKDNRSSFEAKVSETIYSKSSGFIESHEILSEKKEGSTLRVVIKAVVKAATLNEELVRLHQILADADFPKLMLLLNERYTNQAGQQKWIDNASVIPSIEGALLSKSFEMVAKEQAEKLRREGLDAFAELLADDRRIAEVASQYGAEVVLVGGSEVTFSAYNELGSKMYFVSAVINLRAVNVSTAKVLASIETVGSAPGTNEDMARVKAVQNGAPKAVEGIIDGLLRAWEQEQDTGKRFRVVVLKVKHYRKVARPFIKEMKKIPNVVAIKELNYGGKRLELEVIFKGKKSDLLDGIFDGVAEQKKFQALDKVMDRGDSIELTL